MYGFVSVISVDSGKVLDYIFLSKSCSKCNKWINKQDTDAYKKWYSSHAEECEANFKKSSKAMEAEGAQILFARSVQKHNVRYMHEVHRCMMVIVLHTLQSEIAGPMGKEKKMKLRNWTVVDMFRKEWALTLGHWSKRTRE